MTSNQYQSVIDALAESFGDIATDLKAPHHPSVSEAVQRARFTEQIHKEIEMFTAKLQDGASQFLNNSECAQEAILAFTQLARLTESLSTAEQKERYTKSLVEGKSLQELAQISDETLDVLYHGAKKLHDNKQFKESRDACGKVQVRSTIYSK